MRFTQKLVQLSIATMALMSQQSLAQSVQHRIPRLDTSMNQAFKYKGMDVVIMRDAKISFTQETDNKNIRKSNNLIMSGPFQYEDGTFLGGFKFSNTIPNWKVLADPKEERFANTSFATNNFVFYKNGNDGDFVATKYDSTLDITKMPSSAVQNGLMGLDDGVNVANRTSTNKNDRTGLFGNKSDIAMIKCNQCTVYQMAEVARELGMKEGGIVNTGKDAGYSLQVEDAVTKQGNLTKNNIVITSNVRAWQNRLR